MSEFCALITGNCQSFFSYFPVCQSGFAACRNCNTKCLLPLFNIYVDTEKQTALNDYTISFMHQDGHRVWQILVTTFQEGQRQCPHSRTRCPGIPEQFAKERFDLTYYDTQKQGPIKTQHTKKHEESEAVQERSRSIGGENRTHILDRS